MSGDTRVIAIDGATLIDGNGGPPVEDSVVLVEGSRIAAKGVKQSLPIPSGAQVISGLGKHLIPGLVDTNVHLAPFKGVDELLLYRDRYAAVALETAQLLLRSGVTTARDSYGFLKPLIETRDAISRGDVPGPRLYVAGNIVGWGGFRSMTFDARGPSMGSIDSPGLIDASTSYALEVIQDEMTQGVGEELIGMEPHELREAINAYLDKGVDFVKYGGSNHKGTPALIAFSPRAQAAIVEEVHRRGKVVETHCTSLEGMRMALEAGLDLVQHPEMLDRPISQELVELYLETRVVCSMNFSGLTGVVWASYVEMLKELERTHPRPARPLTGLETRVRSYWRCREWWRENAKKLIVAGCTITTASDTAPLLPPGVVRGTEGILQTHANMPGESTLQSVEGAVELGMTPMQALVCATKNGALASRALDQYGTIDVGKSADLVLLDGDPLDSIGNIHAASLVMARGEIVDREKLPTSPVYFR